MRPLSTTTPWHATSLLNVARVVSQGDHTEPGDLGGSRWKARGPLRSRPSMSLVHRRASGKGAPAGAIGARTPCSPVAQATSPRREPAVRVARGQARTSVRKMCHSAGDLLAVCTPASADLIILPALPRWRSCAVRRAGRAGRRGTDAAGRVPALARWVYSGGYGLRGNCRPIRPEREKGFVKCRFEQRDRAADWGAGWASVCGSGDWGLSGWCWHPQPVGPPRLCAAQSKRTARPDAPTSC